jgi:hypothetical protein
VPVPSRSPPTHHGRDDLRRRVSLPKTAALRAAADTAVRITEWVKAAKDRIPDLANWNRHVWCPGSKPSFLRRPAGNRIRAKLKGGADQRIEGGQGGSHGDSFPDPHTWTAADAPGFRPLFPSAIRGRGSITAGLATRGEFRQPVQAAKADVRPRWHFLSILPRRMPRTEVLSRQRMANQRSMA